MSYFTTLATEKQVNDLPVNPCKLLGFQLVRLSASETYNGSTGEREVLAVILGGKATFQVAEKRWENLGGRPNVFAGKPHSMYLPAGVEYQISAPGPVEIALVSAPSTDKREAYAITPDQVANGTWGAANFRRDYHQILTKTAQPELPASRLIVGETYTPSGNWSTYPAHKHEVDDLPREACHEEMYFFKVSPGDGFGIARYYNDKGEEHNYTIRDNTMLMIPHGYHTVVSAPGYTTYYLWFLAGGHRNQAVIEDPQLSWVSRAVPMLRDLGH